MKMLAFLLRLLTVVHLVLIASEAASGVDVMKAVGDKVSFGPDKPLPLPPDLTSITWKHIKSATDVVKAIEWDDEGFNAPHPRFNGITTLDLKTGHITINGLKDEHSGVYTIDINSKEQEQRFNLIIKKRVPKPVIKKEPIAGNPDVVYLRCEYDEPIIWKNSAGEILEGSTINKGQSITVKKNGNPENYYTCTLDNGASQETSDRVYERDLFNDDSGGGLGGGEIAGIFIGILVLLIGGGVGVFYKLNENFKGRTGAKPKDPEAGAPVETDGKPKDPAAEPAESVPLKTAENNHQEEVAPDE